MRKHLIIAIENDDVFTPAAGDMTEDTGLVETMEAGEETKEIMTGMDRSMDIAEALESLSAFVKSKSTLSRDERVILMHAGALAVAGTSTPAPTLISTSLEEEETPQSFGEKLSVKVKGAIDHIVKAFGKLKESFVQFFKKFLFNLVAYNKKLAMLESKVAKLASKNRGQSQTARIRTNWLSRDNEGTVTRTSLKDIAAYSQSVMAAIKGTMAAVENNVRIVHKDVSLSELVLDKDDLQKTGIYFFKQTFTMATNIANAAGLAKQGGNRDFDSYMSPNHMAGRLFEMQLPTSSQKYDDYSEARAASRHFSFSTVPSAQQGEGKLTNNKLTVSDVTLSDVQVFIKDLRADISQVIKAADKIETEIVAAVDQFQTDEYGDLSETETLLFPFRMALINNSFVYAVVSSITAVCSKHVAECIDVAGDIMYSGNWVGAENEQPNSAEG